METNKKSGWCTPKLAAQYLAAELGHTPELWAFRLANWRRPGRKSQIEHGTTETGNPVYDPEILTAFVAAQPVGVALKTQRERPRAGAVPYLDGPEEPHVRVLFAIAAVSQSVFTIDADSARKLATMLNKAADMVDRAAHQLEPDESHGDQSETEGSVVSKTITLSAITQPEVVRLLTVAFGGSKSWSDFLADCIRGGKGANFHGLQLHPVCRLPGETGRISRPLYSTNNVRAFIRAALDRGATRAAGPEVLTVELDADSMLLPPAFRRPIRVARRKGGYATTEP